MSANKARHLIYLLEEIIEKEKELQDGVDAWNSEDGDPCTMASCDPSDHYILERDISTLWEEFKDEVIK